MKQRKDQEEPDSAALPPPRSAPLGQAGLNRPPTQAGEVGGNLPLVDRTSAPQMPGSSRGRSKVTARVVPDRLPLPTEEAPPARDSGSPRPALPSPSHLVAEHGWRGAGVSPSPLPGRLRADPALPREPRPPGTCSAS